jgi:hypothetical protein
VNLCPDTAALHSAASRHVAQALGAQAAKTVHDAFSTLTGSRISLPVERSMRHGVAVLEDSQAKIFM